MLRLAEILIGLICETLRWLGLSVRSNRSIKAENLFLRRQLALYVERGVKPRRIDCVTRIGLTLLSRCFNWRDALVVVRPETLIRWHRAGWKLFWRLKSRPGRPPIPPQLQALIRRIANENPSRGEERIANELLLKIGIRVSPRTVSKYLPRRPRSRPRGDLRWSTFLRLHAQGIIACDFFVAVTATFRLLYVFVVIEHRSRRLIHCNVTTHPSAAWTLQQLREAVGYEDRYKFLVHDRDSVFASQLDESIRALGIRVLKSAPHSPKMNAIWHDPQGMSGLADPAIRIPSAFYPEILDRPLQWRAPAHGAGSRGSRSAGHHEGYPGAVFATSSRRIICGPLRISPWWAAS
jgi:putative transposase